MIVVSDTTPLISFLKIDEVKGRLVAKNLGLKLLGTVGIC